MDWKMNVIMTRKIAFKKEREHKKKRDKTRLKVTLFIVIGVLLFLISSILEGVKEMQSLAWADLIIKNLVTILSGVSISIIAGAILTYIIDIPSKLKEYETSFLNALSSNNYLKSLDESKLIQLRKDTTEQLHAKNAPFMATGLIDIDQRICDLLKQPYYTRYRQSVICSDIANHNDYVPEDD